MPYITWSTKVEGSIETPPPPVANSDYRKSQRISNFSTHEKDPVYIGKGIFVT
jgi:hypothetical protein